MDIQLAKKLRQRLVPFKRPKYIRDYAVLGNGQGVVTVPGTTYYCYARRADRDVVIVFNSATAHIDGLPVIIGYNEEQPNLLRVLDIYVRSGVEIPAGNVTIGPHHERHEWGNPDGGDDVVYVHVRQITDKRIYATGNGLEIGVTYGVVYAGGSWSLVGNQTLDLTSYQPANGAKWVLVSVGDGGLSISDGITKSSTSLLQISDIPAPEPGKMPLAAVRLYDTQTIILDTFQTSDILDLRMSGTASASSVSLSTALGVLESEIDYLLTNHILSSVTAEQLAQAIGELDYTISKNIVDGG